MRIRVTSLVLSLALLVIALVGSCANVMPVNTNIDSTLSTTQSISQPIYETVSPTSITVGSVQGLTLTLSLDNVAYQPGQGVTVTLDEWNTLPVENVVATATLYGIRTGLGGAAAASGPLGVALYKGHYVPGATQSTAMQLSLYNPYPYVMYLGPIPEMVNSYRFAPLNDMAVKVTENHILATDSSILTELPTWPSAYPVRLQYTINQYWQGGEAVVLTPGVYTVVAQDEWGATAVLNFTVGPITTTTAPITLDLQRPPTNDFVKILAPFILGSSHTPLPTDPTQRAGIFVIPFGSVIYHWANGITEVSGPDGKRVLIAKDSEAGIWAHPIPIVLPPATPPSMVTPDTWVIQFSDGSTEVSNVESVTMTTIRYVGYAQQLTIVTSPDPYPYS
jgi:hypothetical protein